MKKISCFIILILFLLPTVVYAKSLKDNPIGKAFIWLGFPENWLEGNSILYYGFIPFLGIWMIVYGFLALIRIFGDNKALYTILSFIIAFSTIPLGMFVMLVGMIFSVMGVFSVVIFAVLFFVGGGLVFWRQFYGFSRGFSEVNLLRKRFNEADEKQAAVKEAISKILKMSVTDGVILSLTKPNNEDSYPPDWKNNPGWARDKNKIKAYVKTFQRLEKLKIKINEKLQKKEL